MLAQNNMTGESDADALKKRVVLERVERRAQEVPYFLSKDIERLKALCAKVLDMDFSAGARVIDKREIYDTLQFIIKEAKISPAIFRSGEFFPARFQGGQEDALRNLELLPRTAWGRAWNFLWEDSDDPFLIQSDVHNYRGVYHYALTALLDYAWDEINIRFRQKNAHAMPRQLRAALQSFLVPMLWSVLATHFKRVSAARNVYKVWVLERLINLTLKGYGILFCAGRRGQGQWRLEIRVPVWSAEDEPEIIECKDAPWLQVSVLKDNVYVHEKVWRTPDEIHKQDVLDEPNVEVRRVMLETMGNEKFLQENNATVIHATSKFKLYRTSIEMNSRRGFLHIVHCVCPSTGHEYYLRVPPDIMDAEDAIAWTFGESRETYQPVVET